MKKSESSAVPRGMPPCGILFMASQLRSRNCQKNSDSKGNGKTSRTESTREGNDKNE
ncbi:unnamed protein product, partial [Ceratitis capitata]